MSTSIGSMLKLGNLPSDVIRKIITVGIDSIDDLKLITRRWRTLVSDHLVNRNRLPAITCCTYVWSSAREASIGINYPVAFKKYFGMLNKANTAYASKLPVSENRSEFNVSGNNIDFLRRVFARCSSVESLILNVGYESNFKPIERITGAVKIDQLRLNGFFAKDKVEEIVKFVNQNTVRILLLRFFEIQFIKESGNFFIEVSSVVSKIQFVVLEVVETDAEMERIRATWKDATDWLNKTGKITAKLDEEPEQHEHLIQMCITVKRKADN